MAIDEEESPIQSPVYHPSEQYKKTSHISSLEQYHDLYRQSIENPELFWRDIAINEFYWKKPPSEKDFLRYNFDSSKKIYVEWMKGNLQQQQQHQQKLQLQQQLL